MEFLKTESNIANKRIRESSTNENIENLTLF